MQEAAEGVATAVQGKRNLQDLLEANKEWSRAVIYNHEGKVLASTFDVDLNDIEELLPVFHDEDNAFRFGLDLAGEHFDVHRFYDTLVYGRRADQKTGDGICICRTKNEDGSKAIFVLITYAFPTLSAKAIPDLQQFCKAHGTSNWSLSFEVIVPNTATVTKNREVVVSLLQALAT